MVTMTGKKPINKLYAWLSKDENGNEGIVTVGQGKAMLPMIASDDKLLKMPALLDAINKSEQKIVWAEFERKHIVI